jgi:hypothetical protein
MLALWLRPTAGLAESEPPAETNETAAPREEAPANAGAEARPEATASEPEAAAPEPEAVTPDDAESPGGSRQEPADTIPEGTEATLLFSSDVDGLLIDAPCAPRRNPLLLARLAGAVKQARRAALRQGGPEPLLFDAGDALFPSPLMNLVGQDPTSAARLARGLADIGYVALAAGDATLAAPPAALGGLLEATTQANVPLVASNVECDGEAAECEESLPARMHRHVLVRRGALQFGFANVLAPEVSQAIPESSRGPAEVTSPTESARRQIAELREQGADLVVLISNVDHRQSAPRRLLDLLAELEGSARPDVVVAANTAHVTVQLQTSHDGPAIVTALPGELTQVRLRRMDQRWQVVETSRPPLQSPDTNDEFFAALDSLQHGFCQTHNRALAGGGLSAPLDRAAFGYLVLHAMRAQARAEIALIDQRAISNATAFPLRGRLSAAQLHRALPHNYELRMTLIKGVKLPELARRLLDMDRALTLGLERREDKLFVNGREIHPDAQYRLVTTAYVARGGEDILEPETGRFREVPLPEGRRAGLTERVIAWLDFERDGEPYDPQVQLNLYRRPLWFGSMQVDAGLAFASIRDRNETASGDRRYNQAQLTRKGVFDIRLEAEAQGGLSTRGHEWNNQLRLKYGHQRQETEVGSEEYSWAESVDLIEFRSTYDMDYIRDVTLEGVWYGPSIFLEYQLESEFHHERPPGDSASTHFLEMTGLLGLKFKPLAWLRASAAFALRVGVLDPTPFPVPGLSLRAEVLRRRFFSSPRLPVYLLGFVDYFVGWPSALPDSENVPAEGSTLHRFTTEIRAEVTLIGPLRLTSTVRLFLYDESPGSLALAFDSTVGLSIALNSHRQSF